MLEEDIQSMANSSLTAAAALDRGLESLCNQHLYVSCVQECQQLGPQDRMASMGPLLRLGRYGRVQTNDLLRGQSSFLYQSLHFPHLEGYRIAWF